MTLWPHGVLRWYNDVGSLGKHQRRWKRAPEAATHARIEGKKKARRDRRAGIGQLFESLARMSLLKRESVRQLGVQLRGWPVWYSVAVRGRYSVTQRCAQRIERSSTTAAKARLSLAPDARGVWPTAESSISSAGRSHA